MRDENGKWINPNKLSGRERMDRYLESQGLLNYQTRGMSAGDIQQRYQNAGVRLADNSQWGRQNYGDNFENQFRYPQVQVSNINGASADAARMTGLANLYRGGAQVNPANIKGPAQDPNAQTMLDPMGRPVTISGRAQQVIQNQATRAQQRAQADANNKFVIGATTEQVQKGEANWTDISSWDRKQILQDPNFYKGDIAKYSAAQQQQILADPSFNWDNVPKWQRTFYQASSNPAGMGALQGLVMGAGNPGGALTGAAMGWAATVLGYDPTKEFWKQGNDKITFDKEQAMEIGRGAFGFLNWAAENVEKSVGFGIQAIGTFANKETGTLSDLWKNRKAAFDAGAITYDLLGPYVTDVPRMYAEAIEKTTKEGIPFNEAVAQVLNSRDGQILQTVIGSNMPVAQGHGDLFTALNWAKNEIDKGANYREIMTELQTGVEAQISDMALQGMADPLNLTGEVQAKAGEITARIQGDKIAEAAFKQSLAGDKPGYQDAKARLQNTINTPGEAAKIDPNFKIDEMGWMTQRMSGLTKDGQIKGGMFESAGGLLDNKPREKNLKGFIQSLTDYTPEARARIGQDMLVGNVGKIMASYFNGTDVEGFGKWWRSFQQGDMTQAADLSAAVMNAPEFYTTLPAAKGFDIDSRLAAWQQTDSARQMVRNMADTLGENPVTFIENMAKQGTAEQDFIRLTERLKALNTPEAKAMLKDIADGRLTVDILADSVKMFSKGDVAFHPGQWMAETLNGIQEHYDNWAIDHFKLEAESRKTLFRVSSVLKSMQSVLLLGANPGYMISNVLPTMVTRAIDGVWGYMTPTAIDDFMTRMGFDIDKGFSPSRLEEGVGPGGLVDQARSAGDPIRNATRGKGILTSVEDALGKIGRNMPFNKLSRVMEGYEGKQAYAIGIKKFMGEGWRRGKGFKTVPAELAAELSKVAGPRAADILHSAIEAGLTQQEIKNIVSTASGNMQSRALIHEAAQSMNVETSKAASMLEQAGVLDALDNALKGANTEGRIERAFKQAKQTAKQKLDEQAVRDNTATIEHVANRLQTEGMKAITDIVLDTESQGIEQWLQHYERMGEVADAMDSIDNADVRSRLWSLKYSESSAEFRRYNAQKAATYMGVLKATGLDNNPTGRGLLSTMAETDQALDNAYRTMRQLRDEHFQKWNSDWDNPRRQVERNQIDKQIEKVWADATRKELQNSAKFGELLATQYEQLYGIEAGEMARQAWEQITAFRKEMTTRRDAFRKSIEGMPYAARQIESKKFWGETYKYAIVEMERVKTEAINELDRIARGGGGQPQQQNGPLPTEPPAGYKPDEWAELRKAAEERQAAREAKINGIWEVAAEYGYTREDTRGLYGLLGALSKEEYGGDPTFTGGMKEASDRFTPEQVTDILEKRRTAKTFEEEQRQAARNVEYQRKMEEAKAKAEKKMPHDILASIITFGGIDWQHVKDITGEKNPPANQKKIFSKTGKNRWALDEMARVLADDGFSIDLNDPNDTGGLRQVTDLIQRAFRGEKIYNMEGADKANALNEKALAKAEAEFYADRAAEDEFNTSRWEVDMMDATERMDFAKLADLIEQLPADLAEQQFSITGETYGQYVSRAWDETSARQATEAQDVAIAEGMTRSADALTAQENAATAGYTRQKFQESLTSIFGLPEDQVSAFMEVADGVSRWYENATGENADQFYSRYYGDIAKAGDDAIEGLFQQNYPRIDVSNRKMTQADAENYARMLVRAGERELRAAIRNEGNKADRVAILQAAHEINPDMAESVARSSIDVLFQEAWHRQNETPALLPPNAAVTFDGIKASMKVWETANITTVIHENAHIYRRVMEDVVLRTGNERIRADLNTIEEWAGVKEGAWTRDAEEKFARGFERYMTSGEAPTPKLRAAFQKIKEWMLGIYRSITGSPIDINITPEVKAVFDRMVAGSESTPELTYKIEPSGYPTGGYIIRASDGTTYTRKGGKLQQNPTGQLPSRFKDYDAAVIALKKAGFTDEFDNNLAKVKEAQPTRPVEKVDTRLTVDPNKQPFELTFEEFKVRALEEQNALAQNNSKTLSADRYGNIRETYNSVIEKALIDNQPVPEDVKQAYYQAKKQPLEQRNPMTTTPAFKKWFGDSKVVDENGQPRANILFQEADPRMPLGGYEEAAQWKPEGQAMDEIWTQEISPLLDKMEETAKRRLTEPGLDGAYKDMSPEGQKMLQQYLKGVQNDLASTKMAAIRWGEQKRDTAMLNYNKRYGADRYLDVIFPYQFFYTRSMITWAKRAADNPALLANYARLRRQQDRYKNNLPERLRGKMRIEAPWMPDWMGDALYIDPLSVLFTPHAFMRPMEQMVKDQNYQTIEAERILQEWAADGSVSQDQITQAARDRSGSTWERAMAESKMRREAEISNPMDFMATMLGPAWYLTTPAKLLSLGKDGPNTLTELPLTRTARAFENVTKDTWAEPAGKLIGMLAKPEEALRKKLNIPEYGEYGDYYTDRAIANMVAEGKITSEDATLAMIERKGAIFDEAKSRVELELAMRVPLAGAIYASTHGQNALDGMMEGLKALPASLFGSGLLPEGELEYRGLKQEWNEAWKLKDAGDAGAINRFFDDHPEYEAYLAKGKQPDDRLKSFLVGQIWDGYMALGTTDRKTATAEMGDLFKQAFLDSETRSYDTLDVETLTQWAQMLNKRVPTTPQTLPAIEAPRKIDFYAPEVTAVTDQYFEQRSRLYPDYYQTQSEYYNLPKSERRSFLVQHPELAEYWDWNRGWKQRYPELEPIFTGKVFKRVDTSNWNPMLVEYVADYAYSGEQLPKGAWKALEQEWIKAGQPGGSLQSWIDSTVAPAMLYQP